MSSSGRGPVKVVIINTEYVETDATSFKSVVQSLTGKDSSPNDTIHNSPESGGAGGFHGGGDGGGRSPVLKKGLSFIRDLDKLLLELPSMDDIYRLCAD